MSDRLSYTLVPIIIGVLIVVLLTPSGKTGSKSANKISNRFGSGEFFDPIADIYDVTNRIMVSMFLMFTPLVNPLYLNLDEYITFQIDIWIRYRLEKGNDSDVKYYAY